MIIPYREALRHAQGRELCRTAPPCGWVASLIRADGPADRDGIAMRHFTHSFGLKDPKRSPYFLPDPIHKHGRYLISTCYKHAGKGTEIAGIPVHDYGLSDRGAPSWHLVQV